MGGDINAKTGNSWTPLHEAVEGDNPSVVEYLIGAGADITCKTSNGQTPLNVAKMLGRAQSDWNTFNSRIAESEPTLSFFGRSSNISDAVPWISSSSYPFSIFPEISLWRRGSTQQCFECGKRRGLLKWRVSWVPWAQYHWHKRSDNEIIFSSTDSVGQSFRWWASKTLFKTHQAEAQGMYLAARDHAQWSWSRWNSGQVNYFMTRILTRWTRWKHIPARIDMK